MPFLSLDFKTCFEQPYRPLSTDDSKNLSVAVCHISFHLCLFILFYFRKRPGLKRNPRELAQHSSMSSIFLPATPSRQRAHSKPQRHPQPPGLNTAKGHDGNHAHQPAKSLSHGAPSQNKNKKTCTIVTTESPPKPRHGSNASERQTCSWIILHEKYYHGLLLSHLACMAICTPSSSTAR